LAGEEDPEVQLLLANSLLGNFDTEAVDLCWPMVADMDSAVLRPSGTGRPDPTTFRLTWLDGL
jgi:hypothetical protein